MGTHRWAWIAVGLAMCSSVPAQLVPDFSEPRVILEGYRTPNHLTVTDLNDDGVSDLLVTATNDNDIVLLMPTGLSSPEFTIGAVTPAEPLSPWGVSAGDIDGDGDTDIALASLLRDDRVTWFENLGEEVPTFAEHLVSQSPDTSSNGARYTAIADLDGDGDLDVVSTNDRLGRVFWHENLGGEPLTWSNHTLDSSADGAWGVAVADLDDDGDLDVLAATRDDEMILWYESSGTSSPVFTRRVIANDISGARSVATADFDGDGDLDVVSTASYNDAVRWHENLGGTPLSFATHTLASGMDFALDARPVDINADGAMDIIACARGDNTVVWCENSGTASPTFTVHTLSEGIEGASSVVAADFDGDGDVDIVATGLTAEHVYLFENLAGLTITDIRTVDFSGDGVFQRGEPGVVEVAVCSMNSGLESATALVTVDTSLVMVARPTLVFDPPDAGKCVTLRFPIWTSPEAECGTTVTFTVALSWGSQDTSDQATLTLGEGLPISHILTEMAELPIPDGDLRGLSRSLSVPPSAGAVTSARVDLDVVHPNRGDLLVTLRGPAGQTFSLFSGDPTGDLPAEPASFSVPGLIGEEAAGIYTLTVVDHTLGNSGALVEWTLRTDHQSSTCTPWDGESLMDVLLGIEPVSPAYDYNRDGNVDAGDLVMSTLRVE